MAAAGRNTRAAAVALGAFLFGFAAWPAVGADPEPAPFAATRNATVEVVERYAALRSLDQRRRPVDVAQDLPTLSLPFRSVLESLLGHAGVEALRPPGVAADLRLVVECRGTTTGQLYDAAIQNRRIRELRYTDATLEGTLTITAGAQAAARTFAARIEPPTRMIAVVDGGDPRRDPHYAPFRQAFEATGGPLDAIGQLVRALWGDAVLERALGDRDPLVRLAASRGLGRPEPSGLP